MNTKRNVQKKLVRNTCNGDLVIFLVCGGVLLCTQQSYTQHLCGNDSYALKMCIKLWPRAHWREMSVSIVITRCDKRYTMSDERLRCLHL